MWGKKKDKTNISKNMSVLKKEIKDNMVAMIFTYSILCTLYSLQENSQVQMAFSIGGIIISVLLGFITLIKIKKDEKIVLLFRAITIIILSFGFLWITDIVGDMFYHFKNKTYVYISNGLYILILISNIILINKKLKKPNIKAQIKEIKIDSLNLIIPIGCSLSFCIITPLLNRYTSQNTRVIIIMGIFLLVSYLLLMSFGYYLEQYIISKRKTKHN